MKSNNKTILLAAINAKYIHSNPAIYSLKACLGELTSHVKLKEYTINNSEDHILQDIFLEKPGVLCFSCYIWNIKYVVSIAAQFHKLCPDVPIWLGGPEVSFKSREFLEKHPFITGIMIGEGEETFREICSYYIQDKGCPNIQDTGYPNTQNTGCPNTKEELNPNIKEEVHPNTKVTDYPNVKGTIFRDHHQKIITTPPRPLTDLNNIPFLYNDLQAFANRIIYYESSRGCPFSCSYCLSSVDKQLRFRDLEKVKNELLFFLDNKVPQVKFIDRTFNCSHERTMEIWQFLKDNDNGITNFHFEISADILSDDEITLLSSMRPGLVQLEVGVQTVNTDTIREIRRSMDISRLKDAVTSIRKVGNIHQHLDLIAGLPYEGFESFKNSFDEIFSLWPDQLQLGFLKVLKGSYMYDNAGEYGLIYHDSPPYEVLATKWLSFEELIRIKGAEEMLEVYYNSAQYEITMKLIYAMWESMFDFFLELGDFYKEKGYNAMSHSRIKRCEILMEFLASVDDIGALKAFTSAPKIDMEMIKEALVFDLYYRENCKHRPEWAVDVGELRDMTRKHCKNGKLSHVEPFHYDFPYTRNWDINKLPIRHGEPLWVLFSYDKRNPLDHQAKIDII